MKKLSIVDKTVKYNLFTKLELLIFFVLIFFPGFIGVLCGKVWFYCCAFSLMFILFVSFRDSYYLDKKNKCLVGDIVEGTMFSHFCWACYSRPCRAPYHNRYNTKLYVSSQLSSAQVFNILQFKRILYIVDFCAFLFFPVLPSILITIVGLTLNTVIFSTICFILSILILYFCSRKISIPEVYTEFSEICSKKKKIELNPFFTEILRRMVAITLILPLTISVLFEFNLAFSIPIGLFLVVALWLILYPYSVRIVR